jgi:hypothetical protein
VAKFLAALSRHNESPPAGVWRASFRYARACVRYAGKSFRYAGTPLRYAKRKFRYAGRAVSLRGDGGSLCEGRLALCRAMALLCQGVALLCQGVASLCRDAVSLCDPPSPPSRRAGAIGKSGFYRTARASRHHPHDQINLPRGFADEQYRMILREPPMSNADRQRRFRARNPGYRNRFRHKLSKAQLQAMRAKAIADAEALVNGGKAEAVPPAGDGQYWLFPI